MDNQQGSAAEFLNLLLAFQAIPATRHNRTFMDISGYPHYENVASNILAFYLNPTEEHGLGTLLLDAVFAMAGVADVPSHETVRVEREWYTGESNRIDIAVIGDSFVIAIENKIYHHLSNDLLDYASFVDGFAQAKNKRTVIKMVLGLNAFSHTLPGDFQSFCYSTLWEKVKEQIGLYLGQADKKWLTYFIDFIESTTNLAGENMDLKKNDQFFIDHYAAIEKLVSERDAFYQRLAHKVEALAALMRETEESKILAKAPWIYLSHCLVLDFWLADAFSVAFDLTLGVNGWELQLFGRNKKSEAYLYKLLRHTSLQGKVRADEAQSDRLVVQTWEINTNLLPIKDALRDWINVIATTAKATAG